MQMFKCNYYLSLGKQYHSRASTDSLSIFPVRIREMSLEDESHKTQVISFDFFSVTM